MATGNSKAAKSARVKLQLRDKKGRWIEMGGGVKWYSPNMGKYMFGTVVDATSDGKALVEVKHPTSGKPITMPITPSQLEKVSAKASLSPNSNDVIKPDPENKATVEPAVEKNNKIFEDLHKNPVSHEDPFGDDYESIPFDPKGTNNLQKNDLVTYYAEGVHKKGHVIGKDPATGNPIIQPETSSTWGFSGDGKITPLDKISGVYKQKASSPSNEGGQKKADVLVPSPDKVPQGGFGGKPAEKPETAEEITSKGKKSAMAKAIKAEEAEVVKAKATEKAKKLDALMSAEVGTRLLSSDETTINLVKQDAGYWTEEGTGANFTSIQVAEKFAGEKGVSMIAPPAKPNTPGVPSSTMTSKEFKETLSESQLEDLNDDKIVGEYTVTKYNPAFTNPGINQAELDALLEYVGDSSFINQALRSNNSDVKSNQEYIAALDQLIDKSPLAKPVTVWRGIRANPTIFEAMQNQGTYHDKAFSSTSEDEKIARDWIKGTSNWSANTAVTLQIKLPAGFKAHRIDYSIDANQSGTLNAYDYDYEEEVLLPRNTAFKITSLTKNTNNDQYTAVVEPVLTDHNSIKGTKNDGNTSGSTGDTGDSSTVKPEETTDTGGKSETLPIGTGGDNNPNGGGDSGAEETTESGPSTESGSSPEDGPVTSEPVEQQELGKLYTDAAGQYMAGTDGQKFRKGDKVSYTKKGETQEGTVIALYEGVKSARVEWPDGSNSIKKINTLKSLETAPETDTAPVQEESTPAAEVSETPAVPETIEVPKTIDDFATSPETHDQVDFDNNLPIAIADIPVGSVLKLKNNPDFALKKIGPNDWRTSSAPDAPTSDVPVSMAMGMSHNGKSSYDIYMPKTTTTPEAAPEAVAPEKPLLNGEEGYSPVDGHGLKPAVEETTTEVGKFSVVSNEKSSAGTFHAKTTDGSKISVGVDTLKEGDKIYAVGTQTKPYATHANYGAKEAFINAAHPAGIGTVIKNDPKKPYVQVVGADGNKYFPSKNFVATKESPELNKLIAENAKDPAIQAAYAEAKEEVAAPEELAEMEQASSTPAGPIDVSSWKKLKASSGSNPGGEYEAPDGSHFFIKQSKSDLHAKNEVLASDIYQAAGINSLELGYSDVDGSGKLGTIAPMLTGAKDNFESALSNTEYRKEFQKGWAVDAWLGNWDVVGLAFDNALTDENGKAIRVDPGGALLFRAMGSPKTDAQFSNSVTEWDSMRTDPDNYQAYKAFGDMNDFQIKESVAIVASFTNAKIDELVEKHDFNYSTEVKLKKLLKARRDDLIERASKLSGTPAAPPLAQWEIDLLNGGKDDEDSFGSATEDDVLDSMDEEITNESVSPTPFVEPSLKSQEALDALKKKLQGQEAPVDEDEGLAEWEKELFESAEAEAKEAQGDFEKSFTPAGAKPGTVYQLDNGQDAVVGKNNTEISYGKTVTYTKKGETKTGVVSNIMVNQQSAKIVWSDGSYSIIKGSQLLNTGTSEVQKPEVESVPKVEENSPFTTSAGTPTEWVMEKWSNDIPYFAKDYPIGTVMGNITDSKEPTPKTGWQKIGENAWRTQSAPEIIHPDSEMDAVKGSPYGNFAMYVPGYGNGVPKVEEKDVSSFKPSTTMLWAQQDGNAEDFPIGTVLSPTADSKAMGDAWSYEKTDVNKWTNKNSTYSYVDAEIVGLSMSGTDVTLPEGYEFFEPDTKSAYDYPVGTTMSKGKSTFTKADENTWDSKNSTLDFNNSEINALSMPSSWIVKIDNPEPEAKKEESKISFLEEVEQANNILAQVYASYEQSVGEENAKWDVFSEEFDQYLPDGEKNWVTVNNQKFFVVPNYSDGPTMEVAIQDEYGQIHATVAANSGYGNFDSYFLGTKLDVAFDKLKTEYEAKTPAPVAETDVTLWEKSDISAANLPVGSKIVGVSTVIEKDSDGDWFSQSGSPYSDAVLDAIKTVKGAGWKLEIPSTTKSVEKDSAPIDTSEITKSWESNAPHAKDFPIGSKISQGIGAGNVVFEKIAPNSWKPTSGMNITHNDEVMNNLKNSSWQMTAPTSAFEKKAEPVVAQPSMKDLADQFIAFSQKFSDYMASLPDMSYASIKGNPLEFELDGQKFEFVAHPMSSTYAQYMQLKTDTGAPVFSENDFEMEDKEAKGFEASDVFNAAKEYVDIANAGKSTPVAVALNTEYKLSAGTTLADVTYEDFAAVPAGTKINYVTNGKVYGTYLKNTNNTWRFQQVGKEKPSHLSETNADFKFFFENNKEAAANYLLVAPDAPKVSEQEKLVQSDKPNFVLKHQKLESKEQLENYPVDTIIKQEGSAYANVYGANYWKKNTDGNWTKFHKTLNTVSEKAVVTSNSLYSAIASWSKLPVAISIPTDDTYAILGSGEHAYVGDIVIANGTEFILEKINKTALNLKNVDNGTKVKVPAKKLFKDASFGVKDTTAGGYQTAKYDTSTTSPIASFVATQKAEAAAKEALLNFAGASSSEYDAQGLGLPVSSDALKPKAMGLSVIPVEPGNSKSPLFGKPKPVMPESPDEYPSFEESVLDGLPKWDSAEWLAKVEERYLQNPNKKFANVQKSTQWGKIQEVLKGNEGYKSYLNQLLQNKYVDQELFDMAEKAIQAQEKINKPLKKAHQENVAKEKAEYEAKKVTYLAEYNDKVKQYQADLEEWSKVNINASAIKKLPVLPLLENNPFTGGPADWTKSHPGTYSVDVIMNTMREDNVLGRFGLAAAVDSDRIEENSVVFNKIKDMNGVEKFEVKFKVTHAYGKLLNAKLKNDPAVKSSNGIYYPKKTNMIGKPDDVLAKLEGKPNESGFVNSGTRYEFVDTATSGKVVFQVAAQDGQNISVNHNSVQLLLDVNATPADLQLALENLGIDAKPSTAGALRVTAENKLITMYSGESNWGNENLSGEQRTKALKKIKDTYNLTVDDVVVETDAWGRVKFFISDAKAEELANKSGIAEFHHSLYAGEDIDVWESILSGANPGLAANYFRGQHGIGILKSGTGMSPEKDMAIGSGAGIFMTAVSSKLTEGHYGNYVAVNKKEIFRRLDAWANASDNYGQNDKGKPTPGKLMKGHSFHEIILRDGVPVSDFKWVSVGSTQLKKQLIERLSSKGIFMINSIPLEKFILTSGEKIPETPIMNTPGTGVPASGSAV